MTFKTLIAPIIFILLATQSCYSPEPVSPPWQTGGSQLLSGVDKESNISISPDGKMIAYISHSILFLSDTNGNNIRQLSPKGIRVADPRWSPNGLYIGLILIDTIAWTHQKFATMDVSANSLTPLSITDDFMLSSSYGSTFCWNWSPDNQRIAVISYATDGGLRLKVFKTDGSGTLLNSYPSVSRDYYFYSDGLFSWSPDGSQIIFLSDSNGSRRITVATIGESTTSAIIKDSLATQVIWFPDGNNISYIEGTQCHLYDLRSKHDSTLTGLYVNDQYLISPNGQCLGFENAWYSGTDTPSSFMIDCYNRDNGSFAILVQADSYLRFGWAPSSKRVFYNFDGSIYSAINPL